MNKALTLAGRDRESLFFSAMAVCLAAVVVAGFLPTFFLRPWFPEAADFAAPEPIFLIHGALFAGWMALLIAQTTLIRTRRIQTHRALGIFGAVLAAAMVIVGLLGTLVAARRGFIGVPVPPLQFLVVPLFDIVLFALFAGLAIGLRRNGPAHKRLMLLATVNLIEAAIIRLPLAIPALGFIVDGAPFVSRWLSDIFILLLAVWDFGSRRRLHPVTLWGGLAIIASQPLRFMLAETPQWLAFAGWAVGLLP